MMSLINMIPIDKIKMNEHFIKHNADFVNWGFISRQMPLKEITKKFVDRFSGDLNWEEMSRHRPLDEIFIHRNRNFIHWEYVCLIQGLSEDFIWNHKDFIVWEALQVATEVYSSELISFREEMIISRMLL